MASEENDYSRLSGTKIYLVGIDGSGTEYGPSVCVRFCKEWKRDFPNFYLGEDGTGPDSTKVFFSYEKALEYYKENTYCYIYECEIYE
jgi:hypothetical protein